MSAPLTAIGPPGPIDPLSRPAGRTKSPPDPEPSLVRQAAERPTPPPSEAERASETLVEARSDLPEFAGRELSIRREPELNQVVVQVLDAETKEVVRQIPPDEVLSVLRQLQKTGLLLDKRG